VSEQSKDELLKSMEGRETLALAELLASEAGPLAALETIGEVVAALYWRRKDLPRVVLAGLAGIGAGLAAAGRETDDAERARLLGAVKALAYNIGSFTWPGWNEAGISPGATDLAAGLDAARLNLRLAVELRKGDLPVSRGHWLLGAHLASFGEFGAARRHFEEAALYAGQEQNSGERALAQAFAALVGVAMAEGDNRERAMSHEQLRAAFTALSQADGGAGFAEQVRTAAGVFGWTDLLSME
jgi:hypothetical protein